LLAVVAAAWAVMGMAGSIQAWSRRARDGAPARLSRDPDSRPRVLLAQEYFNEAWGHVHTAWFLDTQGNEYTYRAPSRREADDRVVALERLPVLARGDLVKILELSTRLFTRASPAEVSQVSSFLMASRFGEWTPMEGPCPDAGGTGIRGYVPDPGKDAFVAVRIEQESCSHLTGRNESQAARELAEWVHKHRGQPVGPPKPWTDPFAKPARPGN